MELNNFETKVKEKYIKEYFLNYHRSVQEMIIRGEDIQSLVLHDFCCDINPTELEAITNNIGPSIARLQVVKAIVAVNSLADEDRRIIKEDFIRPNNKRWWEEYYTKSQYYRRKRVAVKNFFELIQ